MTKKRQTPEQIVTLLRQVEVAVANGKGTPQACKEAASRADVLPLAERIRGPEAGPSETAERAREGKLPTETRRGGAVSGETDPAGGGPGKLLSPNRRRQAVTTAQLAPWAVGAAGVSTVRSVARHATLPPHASRRRRAVDASECRVGEPVWPVWVSTHHGVTPVRRLVGRSRSRRAHLASGGAQGSEAAEAARTTLAQ